MREASIGIIVAWNGSRTTLGRLASSRCPNGSGSSSAPVYYIPREDVVASALAPSTGGTTFCEWKGSASYLDVVVGDQHAERAAWTYPEPAPGFERIRDAVAFFCGPMDACFVGDEQATPQPGGFYGGWVTGGIEGPFKGGPGTKGW
jgi:uncharacterized protein (DUF427 family)